MEPLCDDNSRGIQFTTIRPSNLVLNSKLEQAISNQSFVRILLVDDYAPWRRFIIAKLRANHNLRIVGVVSDGLEAVSKAEELQPDLILLDIGLPKMSGIVAARRIRTVAPKSKILFASQTIDVEAARAVLSEGGHGYLVKSDAESELMAAVEAVMQGGKFVSSRLASPAFTESAGSRNESRLRGEDAVAFTAAPRLFRRQVARSHEVQFYADDSLFLEGFTRFISAALKTGNAVVFFGTSSHRNMILERLQAEGPDSRAAICEGRYLALDAAEFLSNFMVNDVPEQGQFIRIVDELIRAGAKGANGKDLRVAACGECAPILWAEGKADAAIRLEELWNEIARAYDIDVLCGYSLESLRCDEDSYTFRRICEEHSTVHSR